MMENEMDIEWGPEIAVDGRPDWLGDDELIIAKRSIWGPVGMPEPVGVCFLHPGDVKKIRLPARHWYYSEGYHTKPSGQNGQYYDLQINGMTVSCNDVIDALGLNFNRGELLKAVWRAGKKPGTDEKYDLDKMVYFATRERDRHG